ncbi:MAG: hypothetical protein MZU84_07270 [Sphingobacterium sp.]|nr:hypothetical protein [Sphingobacterium sp.]
MGIQKPLDDIATIYDSNITLNKSASSYFETAYVVLLGLDKETLQIAVRPVIQGRRFAGIHPGGTAAQHHREAELLPHLQQAVRAGSRSARRTAVRQQAGPTSSRLPGTHKENALIIDLQSQRGVIRHVHVLFDHR